MKYLNRTIIVVFLFIYNFLCGYSPSENFSAENLRKLEPAAEDGSAGCMFLNPSGLWNIKVAEVVVTYNLIYPNLTDGTKFINNSLAVTQKFLGGSLGLGFNQFGITDWYIKNKILLSYGRQLKEINSKIAFGLKLTYDKEAYTLDEYIKNNPVFLKSKEISYFSFSLGSLYMFNEIHTGAFTIDNILQPSIGLYTEEKMPLRMSFGYRYNYKNIKILPDIKFEFSSLTDYFVSLVFEYKMLFFNKKLKFTPSFGICYGNKDYNSISLGFGLYTSRITFNYGYKFSLINKIDTGGQQCISLSYKFFPVEVEEEKISKKEYEKLLLEKQKLEEELKMLSSKLEVEKKEQPQILQSQQILLQEELLKKIEELEKKLKEAETKRIEEKPKPSQPQPVTIPKKRYHTVVEGDTLPKLAEKYYGDASQWRKIYEVNKEKIIRGQLVPGSVLEIP